MQVKKYLMILGILLLINVVSSCSKEVITPKLIKQNINIVPHPAQVKLVNIKFFVVTEDNFVKFKKEITEYGDFVFVAVSVKDYENLSLNIQELKRFIIQQKEIIKYYEKVLEPNIKE